MPTLPLYRQQRTLLTSKKMYAVSSNPTRWGAGWNMDRWVLGSERSEPPARDGADIAALIASLMREVPDFPEPGIQFKDLTPLLADAHGLAAVTDALAEIAEGADLVAGIDARGFLLGAAVATAARDRRAGGPQGRQAAAAGAQRDLPAGIRHRHAGDTRPTASSSPGARSSIIDDVLATGGTVAATAQVAADLRRDRHRRRRGARAGRAGRPRRARTAAGHQPCYVV